MVTAAQRLQLQQKRLRERRVRRRRAIPPPTGQPVKSKQEQQAQLRNFESQLQEAITDRDRIKEQNEERLRRGLGRDEFLSQQANLANAKVLAIKQLIELTSRGVKITKDEASSFISDRVRRREQQQTFEKRFKKEPEVKPLPRGAILKGAALERRAAALGAIGQTEKGDFIFPDGVIISRKELAKQKFKEVVPEGITEDKRLLKKQIEIELKQSFPTLQAALEERERVTGERMTPALKTFTPAPTFTPTGVVQDKGGVDFMSFSGIIGGIIPEVFRTPQREVITGEEAKERLKREKEEFKLISAIDKAVLFLERKIEVGIAEAGFPSFIEEPLRLGIQTRIPISIGETLLFVFSTPILKTAVAAKKAKPALSFAEAAQKALGGKKRSAEKGRQFLAEIERKIAEGKTEEVRKIFNKIAENLKKLPPEERQKTLAVLIEFRKSLIEKGLIKASRPKGLEAGVIESFEPTIEISIPVTPILREAGAVIAVTKPAQKLISPQKLNLSQSILELTKLGDKQVQKEKQLQKQRQIALQISGISLAQAQPAKLKQPTKLNIGGAVPMPSFPKVKPQPKPKAKPLAFFIFPEKKKPAPKKPLKAIPYDVFIKKRKIADNLSRQRALDFGAWVTDNSIAAQWRIKKSVGKVKQPRINIPRGYFQLTQTKYRNYKIVKGKRVPLKNTWIEKQGLRLDTLGEVQQITAARLIARAKKIGKVPNISKFI